MSAMKEAAIRCSYGPWLFFLWGGKCLGVDVDELCGDDLEEFRVERGGRRGRGGS
jgi:hypothetical protein